MSLIDQLARRLAPRVRPARPARPSPPRLVQVVEAAPVTRPAPPPPPRPAGNWRSTCQAVSYFTGRQCRLLQGHGGEHRDERGAFARALRPGERPPYWHRIEEAATRRTSQE